MHRTQATRKRARRPHLLISLIAFSTEAIERLNVPHSRTTRPKLRNCLSPTAPTNSGSEAWHFGRGNGGLYIDDTPVPESIDPRVIDIARVEVLKAPQGTPFGQGSFGSNLRIITVRPSQSDVNLHFQVPVEGKFGWRPFGRSYPGLHLGWAMIRNHLSRWAPFSDPFSMTHTEKLCSRTVASCFRRIAANKPRVRHPPQRRHIPCCHDRWCRSSIFVAPGVVHCGFRIAIMGRHDA